MAHISCFAYLESRCSLRITLRSVNCAGEFWHVTTHDPLSLVRRLTRGDSTQWKPGPLPTLPCQADANTLRASS
ncbi:hypothetical protein LSAT2_007619 [Lamellibrachia satsuma]|nr:hypothetical protein LSAT2_007619 [Lamellibrachia satsuma]